MLSIEDSISATAGPKKQFIIDSFHVNRQRRLKTGKNTTKSYLERSERLQQTVGEEMARVNTEVEALIISNGLWKSQLCIFNA